MQMYTVMRKSDTFCVQPNSQKCVTFRHFFPDFSENFQKNFQKCVTFKHVTFTHDSVPSYLAITRRVITNITEIQMTTLIEAKQPYSQKTFYSISFASTAGST